MRLFAPRLPLRTLFALTVLTGLSAVAGADETPSPVQVVVRDGRKFSGFIDPRTTTQRLWLRTERPGATLARSLAWEAVVHLHAGDDSLEIESLRADPSRWVTPSPPRDALVERPAPSRTIERTSYRASIERVTSIAAEARLVNWDGDVEQDGLLVTFLPLDRDGQILAIDGSLEVELIGEGPGTTSRLSTFPQLARWVETVRADEVGPNGAAFRLPFQAANPEFDLRLGPYGLVHVRFVAAGHGTFETTTEVVTLRPYNPIRDRLQQQTRQRFFPTEQTGVGKRAVPSINDR